MRVGEKFTISIIFLCVSEEEGRVYLGVCDSFETGRSSRLKVLLKSGSDQCVSVSVGAGFFPIPERALSYGFVLRAFLKNSKRKKGSRFYMNLDSVASCVSLVSICAIA